MATQIIPKRIAKKTPPPGIKYPIAAPIQKAIANDVSTCFSSISITFLKFSYKKYTLRTFYHVNMLKSRLGGSFSVICKESYFDFCG